MSEYQFYEFMAIDRPLTEKERQTVSSISSRTEASLYGATFVYNYGGSLGDEYQILTKYFDAMLYIASWGSNRLLFRFPASAVDIEQLKQYEYPYVVVVKTKGDFVILDLNYNDESGDTWGWVEGEGLLSPMVGLRQSIMNGDMRALYLTWLKSVAEEVGYEVIDPEDIQTPPVPHNLGNLSPELRALTDFFHISSELIRASAYFSNDYQVPKLDVAKSLQYLPDDEKDTFLMRVATGVPNVQVELLKRLTELLPRDSALPQPQPPSMTQILERLEKARKTIKQEAEAELNAYLDDLATREDSFWDEIYALISQKKVKAYEEAIKRLVDLKKLAVRDNKIATFDSNIRAIYKEYPNLSGLHWRMNSAGFKKR